MPSHYTLRDSLEASRNPVQAATGGIVNAAPPIRFLNRAAQLGQPVIQFLEMLLGGRQSPQRREIVYTPLPRHGGIDPETGQPIIIPPGQGG